MITKAPSDCMKLLASVNNAIGTAVEDLDAYLDGTEYEFFLITLTSAKLAAETGTDVTLTVKHATAVGGTGTPLTAKDAAGADLTLLLGGSAAAGRGASMVVRTHGLQKFVSPVLIATTAAVTCNLTVHGFNPKDSASVRAHWTDEAGAVVAGSAWT